jgi:two-component system cell cycle response regulator
MAIFSKKKGYKNNDNTAVTNGGSIQEKIKKAQKALPCLRQISGRSIGKKFPLKKGSNILGRDPGLEICIQDSSISRRHAEVVLHEDKRLSIIDLNSTNGVYLNDEKIKNVIIDAGCIIRFGGVVFKYISGGDIEAVYHDELHNLANLDGLTGIYNRKYLMDYLSNEFKRCKNLSVPLSFILFDLDHFKNVNDTYGHLAGDYVLKETSKIISSTVLRSNDIFGRYGGEEFSVILGETPILRSTEIAERIRHAVANHNFEYDGKKLPITISIGVSSITDSTQSYEELIAETDKLLYKAKSNGRNKVCSSIS